MTVCPVDTNRLTHPGAADYFTRNPHRMAAVRAMLDLLSIPFPEWAERDISGRAAANRNMLATFRADNPETLHQATVRRQEEHATRLPKAGDPLASAPIDTSFLNT